MWCGRRVQSASTDPAYTNRWSPGRIVSDGAYDSGMDSLCGPVVAPVPCVAARLARAQAQIRALTTRRRRLSAAERLELAHWQREWVAAWKTAQGTQYVIAA